MRRLYIWVSILTFNRVLGLVPISNLVSGIHPTLWSHFLNLFLIKVCTVDTSWEVYRRF